MIEHEIGQIVGIGNKKFIVRPSSCQGCDLKGIEINCGYLACKKAERSDGVSIVYKELEGENEK